MIATCITRTSAADDRALPTIDEVRSHVDETLSSIVTARVMYRRSQSIDPDSPHDLTDPEISKYIDWQDHVWTWWMDGRKRAMESEPKQHADSERWGHVHETFDGRKTYFAYYSREDPREMTALSVNPPSTTAQFYNFYPDSWLGLSLNRTDQTLSSLLSRPEVRMVGWDAIDGHQCLHVDLGKCDGRSGSTIRFEAWLDPQRDWLPRQIVSHHRFERTAGEFVEDVGRHVVTEFQKVSDALLADDRWFPRKYYVRELARIDCEVLEVAINETLSDSRFVIEPQHGTEVTEWFPNNPDQPVQKFVHGGQRALAEIRQRTVDQARAMSATDDSSPVDASPHSGVSLAIYGWIVAVLFASAAAFVWWRQR